MALTFYFYDLETSGFSPRQARIMQFAGQRTDLNLKPIGDPHNTYIKLTADILPDPTACLVTGITPQKTLADGITEQEFSKLFQTQIATTDTIFVGYNSIRFDDEFMRHLFYRNFYEPYEWQWQDGKSRWDLLDVGRMMRALRPEGIKWPFDTNGKPSNQLGLLTAINKLDHANAHDALGDVKATIALARLYKSKQPKLFNYLLKMRTKKTINELINTDKPFVYTSGKYSSEFNKTTVVVPLFKAPDQQSIVVYDVRYDPAEFAAFSANELAKGWQRRYDEEGPVLPVKTLKPNRCPAVAPLSVLDGQSQTSIKIDLNLALANAQELKNMPGFINKLKEAQKILDKKQQERLFADEHDVDDQLYEGFFTSADKTQMSTVRTAHPVKLGELANVIKDKRLKALLPLYKARNYPEFLTPHELTAWNKYKHQRIASGGKNSRLVQYLDSIKQLMALPSVTKQQKAMLSELRLYGENILAGA